MISEKKFFAFSQPIENFFVYGDKLHICWKDFNGAFLGCSDLVEAETGLTASAITGLDDRDLVWEDRACQYRADELAVVNSRSTRCIYEPVKTVCGEITLLTFKTPMSGSSGLMEGVFQISFILEQYPLPEIIQLINKLGLLSLGYILSPLSNQKIMDKLTSREQECLFHLAYGRSAKEIARLLYCSPRTIEVHISNMKRKLNCRTKEKLLDKTMDYHN